MNEYESLGELALNWMFWFVVGFSVSYTIFSLLEYLRGRDD